MVSLELLYECRGYIRQCYSKKHMVIAYTYDTVQGDTGLHNLCNPIIINLISKGKVSHDGVFEYVEENTG